VGQSTREQLDNVSNRNLQVYYEHYFPDLIVNNSNVKCFLGIYHEDHIHRPDAFCRLSPWNSHCIFKVAKLFSHQPTQGIEDEIHWMKVISYELDEDYYGIASAVKNRVEYIPLDGTFEVTFNVHVVPSFANSQNYILNTWFNKDEEPGIATR